MANIPVDDRSRIDGFLPDHDFCARYEISIKAQPSTVYECLLRSDLSELWLVRLLMTIRSGKPLRRNAKPGDLRQRLQGTGFVILTDAPQDELVIGVAGRFWRPDGGRWGELSAEDFSSFSRPGYAKAAWNFKMRLDSHEITMLATETRIKCFGLSAIWKFRLYWTLVGPFSGLIRKTMLKHVKRAAEFSEGRRVSP